MSKWINCKNCSHEYHSSLPCCPECGKATPSLKNIAISTCIMALCVVVVAGFILGLNDKGGVDTVPSDSKPTSTASSTDKISSKDNSSVWSEQTPSSSTPSQSAVQGSSIPIQTTEQLPTIGTKQIGDFYYSTLPKYFLDYSYKAYKAFYPDVSFEDYAYKLYDEQKSIGTVEIIKNADGSATHKIPKNKMADHTANMLVGLLDVKRELEKEDYISEITQNKTVDTLTINLTVNQLDDIQKYNIVMLGLKNFENQLFTVSQNKTTVIINYADGNTEKIEFPDAIK